MKATIIENTGLEAVIDINITKDDYQAEVDKQLKDLRKKANVPGFRPGNAPMQMIAKSYGTQSKMEQVEKLMQSGVDSAVKDAGLTIILSPLSKFFDTDINWKGDDFNFQFEIGIRPEINPNLDGLNDVVRHKVTVSEDEITKEIDRNRKSRSTQEPVETINTDEDLFIGIEFKEVSEDENAWKTFRGLTLKDLSVDMIAQLEGKSKNDSWEVDDLTTYFTEEQMSSQLSLKQDVIDSIRGKKIALTVKSVAQIVQPELNFYFFAEVFPNDTITTEEQFRERMKAELERYYEGMADRKWFSALETAIRENNQYALPTNYLARYFKLNYNSDNKITEEELPTKTAEFENELRWVMLKDAVLQSEGIETTDEDIWQEGFNHVYNMYMQAGLYNVSVDQVSKYAAEYLKDRNNYANISLMAATSKFFLHLKNTLSPKEEEVSFDEFVALSKENVGNEIVTE